MSWLTAAPSQRSASFLCFHANMLLRMRRMVMFFHNNPESKAGTGPRIHSDHKPVAGLQHHLLGSEEILISLQIRALSQHSVGNFCFLLSHQVRWCPAQPEHLQGTCLFKHNCFYFDQNVPAFTSFLKQKNCLFLEMTLQTVLVLLSRLVLRWKDCLDWGL